MWFYIDGRFVEDDDAVVPATDRSFLYGDGCFEGLGVFRGRVPHLDEHVDRLFRSASMLRIPMPVKRDELRQAVLETARRNGMATSDGYLRPLLSRGSGPLGVKHSKNVGPSRLVIIPQTTGRAVEFGEEMSTLTAVISRFQRAPSMALDPGIKSNNYLSSILAFMEADDRGADLAVLTDHQGFISEGHAMNIFAVAGGRLSTPMASAALRGITRHHVLAVARELGIDCVETNLTTYDLLTADEVFVTSAMESVAPVGAIEDVTLPTSPGPVTAKVRAAYLERAYDTATPVPT